MFIQPSYTLHIMTSRALHVATVDVLLQQVSRYFTPDYLIK